MRYPLIIAAGVALGCVCILRCSTSTNVAGATDMPNESAKVSARIINQSGIPVEGVDISIVKAEYVSPFYSALNKTQRVIGHATTNESGNFTVDSLDSGNYVIEANNNKNSACLIRCTLGSTDTVKDLGNYALHQYSVITGKADTTGASGKNRYVQIFGLQRIVPVGPDGFFAIDSLPADTFKLRIVCADSTLLPPVFCTAQTIPGDTTTILSGWAFSRRIILNTSASAANVAGSVYGFPVLIRLTNTDFTFSQAKAGGDDLRFAKSTGAPLAYEIERWDAANGRAEIWVRTDTLFGNDSTQCITMFWGNPAATRISNGSLVFDTAAGFKAVWHFSQDCVDATLNHMNGTNYGASDTQGIVGNSKLLDGTDSIKIPGTSLNSSSITLSAWVKFDRTDTLGGEVVSLGDDVLIRVDDPRASLGTLGSYRFDTTAAGYNPTSSGLYLQKTGWRYVTFTVDGAGGIQSLYIDGALSTATQNKNPLYYHHGSDISIGTHGYYVGQTTSDYAKCHFVGAIDEVRICGRARSAEWIKLCYVNQKADDKLVVFR